MEEPQPASAASSNADPAAGLLRRWQEDEDSEALDALLQLEVAALKARLRHRGQDLLGASASVSDIAQQTVVRLLEAEQPPHFK